MTASKTPRDKWPHHERLDELESEVSQLESRVFRLEGGRNEQIADTADKNRELDNLRRRVASMKEGLRALRQQAQDNARNERLKNAAAEWTRFGQAVKRILQ